MSGDPPGIIDGTLGAFFLGLIGSSILYGAATVQTFIYFRNSADDDPLAVKLLVAFLWAIISFQVIADTSCMYYWTITNYGNFKAFLDPSLLLTMQVLSAGMSDFLARSFFARRIYILSQSLSRQRPTLGMSLASGIVLLALLEYAFVITSTVSTFVILHKPATMVQDSNLRRFAWTVDTFNPLAVTVDSVIAFSICVLLFKNRSGIKRTDNLVHTLMSYAIGGGLLTRYWAYIQRFITENPSDVGWPSVVAIAAMTMSIVFPKFIISLALYNVNCQLHVNSLLVSLNARRSLRERCDPSALTWAMGDPRIFHPSSHTHQQMASISQILFSDRITCDQSTEKHG